ncbi:MAG: D-aminoacyl-tRNA deacylase [Firmicutes bacterium]|nr:D-aminoacyl-tRNA deacylase [Bacillota bacterium]MDD4263988.1 D-aminoacyl-tRNA deacylase [Bacillota bacterium]MDD4692960.1 D-aminoacyl-tRNA deacylase [Bacillota bacterium]
MLALIQRVKEARVSVEDKTVSRIKSGLLVLLGIVNGDQLRDADYLAEKIVNLRVFPQENKDFDLSVKDIGGEILIVSQFTLAGDCRKGRRPSFSDAMSPEEAKKYYEYTTEILKKQVPVKTGIFGAHMDVSLINDGPVTLLVDSKKGAKKDEN